jgi:hypothetical protein
MTNKFHIAMEFASELNEKHGKTMQGGKKYLMVDRRIEAFRATFGGEYGIETKVLHSDERSVMIQCDIKDKDGFVVSSGVAEEIRGSTMVNKTSAVENCQTSAVGRALSMLGLAGGEFASLNEMEGVPRKEMEKEIRDLKDKIKEIKESDVEPSTEPKMEMTTEDRADAWLTFYDNKPDAQKFSKAEERFQKFMNQAENYLSAEVTANLWDKHDERKTELMV